MTLIKNIDRYRCAHLYQELLTWYKLSWFFSQLLFLWDLEIQSCLFFYRRTISSVYEWEECSRRMPVWFNYSETCQHSWHSQAAGGCRHLLCPSGGCKLRNCFQPVRLLSPVWSVEKSQPQISGCAILNSFWCDPWIHG